MRLEHSRHLFNGAPSRVQVAFDGAWEKAIKFDLQGAEDIPKTFRIALENPNSNVAIEVFFGTDRGAMLGFRHSSQLKVSARDFVLEITRIAMSSVDFLDFCYKLKSVCAAWDFQVFAQEPHRAELGILDFWDSAGSLELWRAGFQKTLQVQKNQFANHWHLSENILNHIMLEFAFPGTAEHWAGFIVSDLEQESYKTNSAKLNTVFQAFGFSI